MPVHAPVAGEGGGHALGARTVRVAVEEREVCGHKLRSLLLAHPQLGGEVVCKERNWKSKNYCLKIEASI